MNAVGIIAEYNPLHNGHVYQMLESKKLAGTDAVIIAMSGNYVQRGEPAIINKWERAESALEHGADLVVEIPTIFCLADAGKYAKAAVSLLESIGCVNFLSFGSESGNIDALKYLSINLETKSSEIDEIISSKIKDGFSYPRAREFAYSKLFPYSDEVELLKNANDNLSIEYLKYINKLSPIAVKRISGENYITASEIRDIIRNSCNNSSISSYIPDDINSKLISSNISLIDEWLKTLKYAVASKKIDDIEKCPSGGEGLGNKIKTEINNYDSWNDLVLSIKSKRYTYTRISRLLLQIILGINNDQHTFKNPEYIRILAANKNGREILSDVTKNELNKLPIITNVSKQRNLLNNNQKTMLDLDIHASDVYNLVNGFDINKLSEYRVKPIIKE